MDDARDGSALTADQADEISIGDLIRNLWASRAWAVGGGALGCLITAGAIALQYVSTPEVTTFRQEISLLLDEGLYPNGSEFSTNDLRSPIVLERVHKELRLESFDLSLRALSSALAITPSSETYQAVIDRYRSRLANANLTFAERQQIETEFSTALAGALSTGARIEFVPPADQNVPSEIGRAIVTAVPNAWADIYINQLGVLKLPIAESSSALVNPDLLASLDYPMAFDVLNSSVETAFARIETAVAVSGAQNLRAPESGRTLYDIRRDLNLLERYSLQHILAPLAEQGLNKSPDVTVAAYRYQVEDLNRRIRLAQDNASVIDAALAARAAGSSQESITATSSTGDPSSSPTLPNTVVQQFGPELVERLVAMSVENASVDFREDLIKTKLEYEREALELSAERDRIEHRLQLISGEAQIENEEVLVSIFTEESERLASELNATWDDIAAILDQANAERLSHDKKLFQFLPTEQSVSTNRELLSRRSIIMIVLAGIGGLMAGIALFFVKRAVRS